MRGPNDFKTELTDKERAEVAVLTKDVEDWFEGDKHDSYQININVDPHSHRVWEHVVEEATSAGWDATIRGAMVIIQRPRR